MPGHEIVVTRCGACKMNEEVVYDGEYRCQHPDALTKHGARYFTAAEIERILWGDGAPPSWCPLRPEHGGPLTVRLEVRDA